MWSFARIALFLRLGLALAIVPVVIAAPVMASVAHADDDDDDDDDGGGGDDDDDDDDDDDGDDDDDDDDDDGKQPPVTAGGMFTKKTWPTAELQRTLTITKGMLEVRGGIDIDVSAQTAFDVWRLRADARYGIKDHIELQFGFDTVLTGEIDPAVASLTSFTAGLEMAIAYDLVDFLGQLILPVNPEATLDLAIGFPFRYRVKPNIGIIALDRLIVIQTAGGDPDLSIGVGGILQATPNLAIIARANITFPDFNTEADGIAIPATVAIQFTPKRNIDIGGEFTLANVKPPGEASPFDQRSLLLFLQLRM